MSQWQNSALFKYLHEGFSCKYLGSLLLPELHLSLHQSLSPARLLLQTFLQFLSASSLVFQGLPAYLHFTLLCNGVNRAHH